MYHSFLIHSSADEHLGCFHVLAIIKSGTFFFNETFYFEVITDSYVVVIEYGDHTFDLVFSNDILQN